MTQVSHNHKWDSVEYARKLNGRMDKYCIIITKRGEAILVQNASLRKILTFNYV